ncbi:methyltransferase domain-containing protein [Nocardia sp. NPDC051463]|uniref:class I SAM-dependent DNA methyltransferase n=1 Tax=Nocardia sp. NPDC051463 TaxID=3154845 RepID=UPI00344B3A4D
MLDSTADTAATRAAYDDIAEVYADFVKDQLAASTFDRAMLAAFAERVQGMGSGVVADIGCGPGRVTAHLTDLGLDVFGIDLSPEMIRLARQNYPQLRFDEGSMERLALGTGTLAGIVAWYSIIHLPPQQVPEVLTEFHRVLAVEGHALLAFQASDDPDVVEPFDHKVIRAYRWSPRRLAGLLHAAGFVTVAQLVREPEPGERFQQAYLLVVKDR